MPSHIRPIHPLDAQIIAAQTIKLACPEHDDQVRDQETRFGLHTAHPQAGVTIATTVLQLR